MIRRFSIRERNVFFLFIVFLVISIGGMLWYINTALSRETPAHTGTWREGIAGLPHLVNPLLALSDADRDLGMLIYSGLLRADGNGGLIHDLAERYTVSDDARIYTFTLKENLRWHDGTSLTADDIAFTITLAKNPALKSPLRARWEGVNVTVLNEREIQFQLEQPYAPFLENTTLGILPKHIWDTISPEQLALSKFNIEPVGSGPYRIINVKRNSSDIVAKYTLRSFKEYSNGEPYITRFEFKFYPSERQLLDAFEKKEIDGIAGIQPKSSAEIQRDGTFLHTLTLPRVFGIFLNQNKIDAFSKPGIREALERALDKEKIVEQVLQGFGEPLYSPIPPGTFSALDSEKEEAIIATSSQETALALLAKNGLTQNEETRILTDKKGNAFHFSISTSNIPDLIETAKLIKTMWGELGIEVEIKIFELSDLNQKVIRPRDYEALLFGEVVGRDPDPFAFWHSSQRNDPGLNIALYTNSTVDKLLEDARALSNETERKEKYIAFQKEVIKDHAAVFLYSPLYLYQVDQKLQGFETQNITMPAERFSRVHEWYLDTKKIFTLFK